MARVSGQSATAAIAAFLLSSAARASTADAGPPVNFQFDPVEYWAARILTWVVTISLAVIVVALIRARKGRLTGPTGKALLLSGVVLLPSFSVGTGMLLVFERAERVEFCGSCHHAMGDFVAEMQNPDGSSLASLHFGNQYIPSHQCYQCHTSYGLFGTMQAKIHGVGQVLRYYTGSFEPPATMWQPYPNADCLKCHARSRKWLGEAAHSEGEMRADLFADAVSCMECHDSGHEVL
jgi:nitrate/TMAO reductase-like tetraheme cytochrome c subunit